MHPTVLLAVKLNQTLMSQVFASLTLLSPAAWVVQLQVIVQIRRRTLSSVVGDYLSALNASQIPLSIDEGVKPKQFELFKGCILPCLLLVPVHLHSHH